MVTKLTKREFMKVAGATAAPQILDDDEEDDEESWFDRWFDDDDEEDSSLEGTIYIGDDDEREDVNPAPREVFLAEDTGTFFRPTDDGNWDDIATIGESPWIQNDDGALTPREGGAVSVEEQGFTAPDDGAPIGKWEPIVDPHPYQDPDLLDYVLSWTPDDDQNFVPLGIRPPGGIMRYNETDGRWEEFIKVFDGGPAIASEIPGNALALETEDASGSETGSVDIRTGFPGDKKLRFRVENDTSDADTGTIGSNDRAFFEALSSVNLYGPDLSLFTDTRGNNPSQWLRFYYNSGAGQGKLNNLNGNGIAFQVSGDDVLEYLSGRVRTKDDASVFSHSVWSSEPPNPQTGDEVIQDGTNWDPAGTGQEEKVCYLNGSWTQVS